MYYVEVVGYMENQKRKLHTIHKKFYYCHPEKG